MATARRLGLRVLFVVLNDGELALIRVKQERKGLEVYGVDLGPGGQGEGKGRGAPVEPPPHYFGVPCVAARSPEELREAVHGAFAADGPTVIEAIVDGHEYSETVYD